MRQVARNIWSTVFPNPSQLLWEYERVPRALEWLIEKAGAGGSWFEFYGERPTPPLPPTGILVWAWAEWITLIVKHLLGAQVKDDQLIIRPRLGGFMGELRFRDSSVPIPNGM